MVQMQTDTETRSVLIAILVICSVVGFALPATATVTNSERTADSSVAPGEEITVTVSSELDSEETGYVLQEKISGSYDSVSFQSATIGGEQAGITDFAAGPATSDGTVFFTLSGQEYADTTIKTTYTVTANDSEGTITITDGESSSATAGTTEIAITEDPLTLKQSASSTELSPGDSTNITATIDNPRTRLSLNQSYQPEVASASISRVAKRNSNTNVALQPVVASATSNLSTVTVNELTLSDTVVVKTNITVPEDASVGSQYNIESKVTSGSTGELTNTTQLTIVKSQDPVDQYAGEDNEVGINDLGSAGRAYASQELSIDELAAIAKAYATP